MKQSIRYIALCLAIVIMAMSFCGCDDLDKAKKNHGFYQVDGTILWNGAVYRELIPNYDTFSPSYDYTQTITITQPDVPVLLKDFLGDTYSKTDDDVILIQEEAAGFYQYDHMVYYCREDKFEDISERMKQEFVPDVYYYEYYQVDEDGYFEDDVTYAFLNEKEIKAIDDILNNSQPMILPETASLLSDYYVDIWTASEDLYFRQYLVELNKGTDDFYLVLYSEDGQGDMLYYEVPEKYHTLFEELLSSYIEAEQAYWEDFDPEFEEEYNINHHEVVVEVA